MKNISIIKTPLKGNIKFKYTTFLTSQWQWTLFLCFLTYYNVNLKPIDAVCVALFIFLIFKH